MSSATPQTQPPFPPSPNPLLALHEAADAETQPWGATQIVSTFGEPPAEYAVARKSCGLIDLPQRGLLEFTGRDRLRFLNNLLTNGLVDPQTKAELPVSEDGQQGAGCFSYFLNLRGRVVAEMNVLHLRDRTLLEADRMLLPMLAETFDLYRFADDINLSDSGPNLHTFALHGPESLNLLAAAADTPVNWPDVSNLKHVAAPFGVTMVKLAGVETIAFRDDATAAPGVQLIVPVDRAEVVWSDLVTRFGERVGHAKRPLRPVGWAVFNALRIEGGRPLLGIDFDPAPPPKPGRRGREEAEQQEAAGESQRPGVLPAETGQFERAVSVVAGCYLGQEIVARLHARGQQVARKIVGIRMEGDLLPVAGAPVEVEGKQVGIVTSSTVSPVLSNAALCLATVKRPHYAVGTTLSVAAEGRLATGKVVETPFV